MQIFPNIDLQWLSPGVGMTGKLSWTLEHSETDL